MDNQIKNKNGIQLFRKLGLMDKIIYICLLLVLLAILSILVKSLIVSFSSGNTPGIGFLDMLIIFGIMGYFFSLQLKAYKTYEPKDLTEQDVKSIETLSKLVKTIKADNKVFAILGLVSLIILILIWIALFILTR